jgi:hypothetical protein
MEQAMTETESDTAVLERPPEACLAPLTLEDVFSMFDRGMVVGAPPPLDAAPTRAQIERLEAYILQMPQVETPTSHYFAPGLYAREMFIPAGTVLTGAVHKTEHMAQFTGDITVWTEDGMKRLTGRHTFVSKAGAKRVGYAHADTWCTGFFPTDKTDVAELERELIEDNPLLLQCNRLIFPPRPAQPMLEV